MVSDASATSPRIFNAPDLPETNTIQWMKEAGILEVGRFLPRQYEDDFCVSIGRNPESHAKNTEQEQDYRGRYNGVYAYATGHH